MITTINIKVESDNVSISELEGSLRKLFDMAEVGMIKSIDIDTMMIRKDNAKA